MVNADDLNQVTTDLQGKPTDDTAQDPNAIVGNTSTQSTADEQSFAGSAPGPGSDDDVGAMMAQVTGNEPPTGEAGTTVAEQVNQDEASRHGSEMTGADVAESVSSSSSIDVDAGVVEPPKPYSETDDTAPDDKQ